MYTIRVWLAAACLSLLAPVSYAADSLFNNQPDEEAPMDFTGFYGGVGVGTYQTDCITSTNSCRSGAWQAYGGYKISEKVSLEGTYYNLGTIDDFAVTGLGGSGVVSYPVGKMGLDVFGKVGVAKVDAKGTVLGTEVKKSATSMLVGFGTDYDIDENWGIRTEYNHMGTGSDSVNLFNIGVKYDTF